MFRCKRKESPTRDHLVQAAAGLLMRQSFGAVSVDDIAVAAGVKKGTFYHHFSSKTDLALAAYDFMWSQGRAALDACFSPAVPAEKRLPAYAESCFNWQRELYEKEGKIYGCPLATAGSEMGAQDERIRAKLKEIFDGHCAYFESVLRDMPAFDSLGRAETQKRACEMFSYSMGVLYQAKVANDPEVIRRDLLAGLTRFLETPTAR
ncbi:MAG TPA: TetR/AcrR family transcriptional regulator [Patescibacteria group bacterium]|nr:TetR/AcrR family transcriptional regulator [Patescibacteria group bacterium]